VLRKKQRSPAVGEEGLKKLQKRGKAPIFIFYVVRGVFLKKWGQ